MSYASQTTVSPERSRAEIEETLKRYKATRFAYVGLEDSAMVAFQMHGLTLRFVIRVPGQGDQRFRFKTVRGFKRSLSDIQRQLAHEQEVRRLWRALLLCIKAKLESVDSGIESLEEAFLSHIDVGGETFGARFIPQIAEAAKAGKMPRLELPGMGETSAR